MLCTGASRANQCRLLPVSGRPPWTTGQPFLRAHFGTHFLSFGEPDTPISARWNTGPFGRGWNFLLLTAMLALILAR